MNTNTNFAKIQPTDRCDQSTTGLVIIDPNVTEPQTLLKEIKSNYQSHLLKRHLDPIDQISEILARDAGISHLHLVCHGAAGELYLGNQVLNLERIERYQPQLQRWKLAEIWIYGCNVAATPEGEIFLQRWHEITGATLNAADHPVGNPALGGSWELGCRFPTAAEMGAVKTWLPFTPQLMASYAGVLGGANFSTAVTFSTGAVSPYDIAIGDFNGDGQLDLVSSNYDTYSVSILLGDGTGSFSAATTFGVVINPVSASVGDFNGDSKSDLAVVDRGGNISILLGDGMGNFGAAATFVTPLSDLTYSVTVGDVNNDGKLDLATAGSVSGANRVFIRLGDGTGNFSAATTFNSLGNTPREATLGDINNDGKQDLALVNVAFGGNVSILLGDGTGSFSTATTFSAANTLPYSLAVGDINGDGNLDLATGNRNNTLSILLGDGTGGFSPATTFAITGGDNPYRIAIGDISGDGNPDIATANRNSNNLSILLGDGSGNFGAATTLNLNGIDPRRVRIADINGDSKPDLLAVNYYTKNISTLINTTSKIAITSGTNPTEAGATPGTFLITLDTPSTSPIPLNLTLGGSAINPTDYSFADGNNLTVVSGTRVSLAAGVTTATLQIIPIDDSLVEPDETIQVTLAVGDCYFIDTANSSASVTLIDNDTNIPLINISKGNDASEQGPTNGNFIITLNQSSPTALTIPLTLGGNATPGDDYTTLPTSITLPAGQTTVTLDVTPVDDTLVDPDETVSVTLGTGTNYSVGPMPSASLVIFDNDTTPSPIPTPTPEPLPTPTPEPLPTPTPEPIPTNTPPTQNQELPSSIAAPINTVFRFPIPENLFSDPEGNPLTLDATLVDGSPLPPWLRFNPDSRTLIGLPGAADVGVLPIKISATDSSGNMVMDTFTLTVSSTNNCSDIIIPTLELNQTNRTLEIKNAFLLGTDDGEQINGTDRNEVVIAVGGNDNIAAGGGNDFLLGNAGNDIIDADTGNDTVLGGQDNDGIYGDTGNDVLVGDNGSDTIFGGQDNDVLSGEEDNDFLTGDVGDDLIFGGIGIDTVLGGVGKDTLSGDIGNDTLDGGADNDSLNGGVGNDWLQGCVGNDTLFGGAGVDTLYGSVGNDTFVLIPGNGADIIGDLIKGEDRLGLSGGLTANNVEILADGDIATIRANGEILAILSGVPGSLIDSSDFTLI